MIKAVFLRLIFVGITVFGVFYLVPGIFVEKRQWALILALLIGFLNAVLKPVLTQFSIGCSILAIAPLMLIFNTMAIWLASLANLGIAVLGFWPAFWGGLVISTVSFFATMLFPDGL